MEDIALMVLPQSPEEESDEGSEAGSSDTGKSLDTSPMPGAPTVQTAKLNSRSEILDPDYYEDLTEVAYRLVEPQDKLPDGLYLHCKILYRYLRNGKFRYFKARCSPVDQAAKAP